MAANNPGMINQMQMGANNTSFIGMGGQSNNPYASAVGMQMQQQQQQQQMRPVWNGACKWNNHMFMVSVIPRRPGNVAD